MYVITEQELSRGLQDILDDIGCNFDASHAQHMALGAFVSCDPACLGAITRQVMAGPPGGNPATFRDDKQLRAFLSIFEEVYRKFGMQLDSGTAPVFRSQVLTPPTDPRKLAGLLAPCSWDLRCFFHGFSLGGDDPELDENEEIQKIIFELWGASDLMSSLSGKIQQSFDCELVSQSQAAIRSYLSYWKCWVPDLYQRMRKFRGEPPPICVKPTHFEDKNSSLQ